MRQFVIETPVIVALITLLGTAIQALGKELLNRLWPERRSEEAES